MASDINIEFINLANLVTENWLADFKNALSKASTKIADVKLSFGANEGSIKIYFVDYNSDLNKIGENADGAGQTLVVQVSPIDTDKLDAESSKAKVHSIYQLDINTKRPVTLTMSQHPEEFWFKLVDVAYDVCDLSRSQSSAIDAEVFLAETGSDLTQLRVHMKSELEARNIKIHSKFPLPYNVLPLGNTIDSFIGNCVISIHMIGGHYDQSIGEDMPKFQSQLQYISDNHEKTYQLIWIDPARDKSDVAQEQFITDVKRIARNSFKGEIIEAPFENFKTILLSRILALHQAKDQPEFIDQPGKKVYVIHDRTLESDASSIISSLQASGYVAVGSDVNATDIEHIEKHRRKLLECDVVVILDNDYQPWLQSMLKDIKKIPGLGRKKPLEKKCLITKANKDINEATLDDLLVYQSSNGFDEATIQKLANEIG